jgi:hypothetical protein
MQSTTRVTAGVILLAESDANMQSMTCGVDLRKVVDGGPAPTMTVCTGAVLLLRVA